MWTISLDRALSKWALISTQMGWGQIVVLLIYLTCVWLCFVCGYSARQLKENSIGWFTAAFIIVLLLIENTLHFTELFVFLMRDVATRSGWYEDRRYFQSITLWGVACVTLYFFAWLRHRLDTHWELHSNIIIGLAILIALSFLRIISLHDTDAVLAESYLGVRLGRVFELTGLSLVFYGTLRKLRTI
jgi:hypothetical protein